jgi:fucose 4-O-acetylase-like acetyltransferase
MDLTLSQTGTLPREAGEAAPASRITHLDTLRGLAIIVVVGIHAFGYAGRLPSDQQAHAEMLWNGVSTFAVPAFFLCDGYLFARAQARGDHGYLETLARSARRLLVPWVTFTVIYTIARGAGEMAGLLGDRLVLGRQPGEIAREWWDSQIAMQLYFLPSLFLIRCLSPALRPLATGRRWGLLVATSLCYAAYASAGIPLGADPVTNAASGLRFYLLGMLAYRYREPLSRAAGPILVVAFGAMLALCSYRSRYWVGAAYQLAYLTAVHAAAVWMGDRARLLPMSGRRTMGIYLLHGPVLLKAVSLVVSHLIGPWPVRFLGIWAATFLIALAATVLVSRHAWGRSLLGES